MDSEEIHRLATLPQTERHKGPEHGGKAGRRDKTPTTAAPQNLRDTVKATLPQVQF